MKIQIVKPGVTDNSSVLHVGAVVTYPDTMAKRLIKGGYAVAIIDDSADNEPDNDTEHADSDENTPTSLDSLTVKELIALADKNGVEVKKGAKKADIIAALETVTKG